MVMVVGFAAPATVSKTSRPQKSNGNVRYLRRVQMKKVIEQFEVLEDKENPVLKIYSISESGNISEEKLKITK